MYVVVLRMVRGRMLLSSWCMPAHRTLSEKVVGAVFGEASRKDANSLTTSLVFLLLFSLKVRLLPLGRRLRVIAIASDGMQRTRLAVAGWGVCV